MASGVAGAWGCVNSFLMQMSFRVTLSDVEKVTQVPEFHFLISKVGEEHLPSMQVIVRMKSKQRTQNSVPDSEGAWMSHLPLHVTSLKPNPA